MRSRRGRAARALLLGVAALALLYAWDDSRQPTSGSTWQLLGARRATGVPWTVRVVPDSRALAEAFEEFRLATDPSAVDLARSTVLWFAATGTQGCPVRFDGIAIDGGRRIVTGQLSRGFTLGCDNRTVIDSFLVIVERRLLPTAPFRIELADPYAPGPTRPGIDVP